MGQAGEGKAISWLGAPWLDATDPRWRARTFELLAGSTLVIATVTLATLIAFEPESFERRGLSLAVLWVVLPLLFLLNRRGFTRIASAVFVVLVIALVTHRALLLGGLRAPIAPAYVVFVLIAGFLLGERAGMLVALLCLGCGALLVFAEGRGELAPAQAMSPLALLLFLAMFMLIALVLQGMLARLLVANLRRAQAELLERQRAQARLSLALDAGQVGVWEQDPRSRMLLANQRLYDLYGLLRPPDGMIPAKRWLELVHPEDRPELDRKLGALSTGVPRVTADYRAVLADGTVRYMHAAAAVLVDEAGNLERFVGVNFDETERKRAEFERDRVLAALRERVKELSLLHGVARLLQRTELSIEALCQRIASEIPSAWAHPECCEARVVCGSVTAATPGFVDSPWQQHVDFSTSQGSGSITVVYTQPRPDADDGPFLREERAVLDSLAEMLTARLELRQHQQDLEALVEARTTELRASRDAAESANRAKGTFLANMSHEIRTPMNAILGYAQLLQADPRLDEAQRRKLEVVRASGEHLLGLINDILEMSRIEAGRVAVAVHTFDLYVLLDQVRSMFLAQAEARGLRLDLEVHADLARGLRSDAGKIRQVLINLIGNAIKFTEQGGICVRAASRVIRPKVALVTLEVADTGPGIAVEDQERIFDAFAQSQAGTQKGGTGLGLAISRNFARLLGGDLKVTSQPEIGSTFTLTFEGVIVSTDLLPARPSRTALSERLDPAEVRRKVLIVDDVETNRVLLDEELTRAGFQTRLAGSGEVAIAEHDALEPDVVLMDLHMPGMGGLAAIERLQASGTKAAIIVTTASTDAALEAAALQAGARALLRKPYLESDLFQVIGQTAGVSFVSGVASSPPEDVRIERDALRTLSADQKEVLRAAAREARALRLSQLAAQLASEHPRAATVIRAAAATFRYDDLLAALQGEGDGTAG